MAQRVTVALFLLFGLALLVYQGPTLVAAPSQQTTSATPEATAEPLKEAEVTAPETIAASEAVAAEPTLAALAARIDALQTQVDALAASTGPNLANEVTTAVYLLDDAGLHGLDERLNNEGVIEASDAGRVARVARLLRSVDWPAELAEDAAALTDTLDQLATALREDDLEAGAPLATQAHEEQHDLSHEAEHWLGKRSSGHGDSDSHDTEKESDRASEGEEAAENSGD